MNCSWSSDEEHIMAVVVGGLLGCNNYGCSALLRSRGVEKTRVSLFLIHGLPLDLKLSFSNPYIDVCSLSSCAHHLNPHPSMCKTIPGTNLPIPFDKDSA